MSNINVLGNHPDSGGAKDFAEKLFNSLDAVDYEERNSDNYLEGQYWQAIVGSLKFKVSKSDDPHHTDLPYWVSIFSRELNQEFLQTSVDKIIRESLLSKGFLLARVKDFGKKNEIRIDYKLPTAAG